MPHTLESARQALGAKAAATSEHILQAAERIIIRDGVVALTLEAVAQEAGVSKGGLLYHYRGKAALIRALIEYQLDQFQEDLERELEREPMAPGRWLRAYVRASLIHARRTPEMSAGLLAAAATDPELLEPARRRASEWQQCAVSDGIDPALGTLVRLAADGLWMMELLGVGRVTGALRENVMGEMAALASGSTC